MCVWGLGVDKVTEKALLLWNVSMFLFAIKPVYQGDCQIDLLCLLSTYFSTFLIYEKVRPLAVWTTGKGDCKCYQYHCPSLVVSGHLIILICHWIGQGCFVWCVCINQCITQDSCHFRDAIQTIIPYRPSIVSSKIVHGILIVKVSKNFTCILPFYNSWMHYHFHGHLSQWYPIDI